MNLISAGWTLNITACTSIVHSDDSQMQTSNQTLFRREKILAPDGSVHVVPIISGNSFRGILRRTGEELLASTLDYAGELTTPAAYVLRSGGTLRKTSKAFTPEDERRLKTLVPLLALFGGTVNGRILSGCTTISKVVPVCQETAHLLPHTDFPTSMPSHYNLLGLETYSHHDDLAANAHPADYSDPVNPLSRYEIETLVAGTQLHATATLSFATDLQYAFFSSILDEFCAAGHLGGRSASGHGRITASARCAPRDNTRPPAEPVDWRAALRDRRAETLSVLNSIA